MSIEDHITKYIKLRCSGTFILEDMSSRDFEHIVHKSGPIITYQTGDDFYTVYINQIVTLM